MILNLFTGQAQDTDLPYESQWSLDKWELSKNKDAIRLVLDLQKAVENNDYEATRSMVSDSINILTSDGVRIQGIDEFEANKINNYQMQNIKEYKIYKILINNNEL